MLLPLLYLTGIKRKPRMHNEALKPPVKPSRKKIDVQVHQSDRSDKEIEGITRKTFSANHPKKCKHRKSTDNENDEPKSVDFDNYYEEKITGKISRRQLMKDNEKLTQENAELQERLTSMDVYVNKKNNKFKEKLNALQVLNEEIARENASLKNQYQELMAQFRACQNELEVCRNCRKCEELNGIVAKQRDDLVFLSKSKQELNEDLNMLKNVIYRLNVQLERYQQKLHKITLHVGNKSTSQLKPSSADSVAQLLAVDTSTILTDNHRDHAHTPVSWGNVNAHTLGPLLDAYQETIADKEEIIEEYERQMAVFTEKMRDILRENDNLHRLLNEDEDSSKVLSAEVESVKRELQSTKEQNDLLIKKCALKQDKLDEVLKVYEQKVEQLKRDLKVLHDEYYKSRSELAAIKEKNKTLLQAQDDFKNERQDYIPVSVHTASVNECKKWYEELKHQYEQEKVKLKENISSLNGQLERTAETISMLNKDKVDMDGKVKAAEKQIKKIETKYLDLQHTLNEVQLSRSACRKQLHKAMNFAKDLVSEQEALLKALNQRQKENKAVKRLGSDIVNRMDTLRSQLKTVQQEAFQELTTVEQRIQEQDSMINSMKREHDEEVDRLKQIIKEKEENNLLLKGNTSIPVPHYLLFRDKHLPK